MSELIIIAFPQKNCKLLVSTGERNDTIDTDKAIVCWSEGLVKKAEQIIVKDNIEKIIFFGPQTYVQKFADDIEKDFPQIPVEIGE